MKATNVLESKRRKTEEIKDDNIIYLTKKFTETDVAEELREYLTEIGRNLI